MNRVLSTILERGERGVNHTAGVLLRGVDAVAPLLTSNASVSARLTRIAGIGLVIAYAFALILKASYVAGGADSSGYLNAARLFGSGETRAAVRPLTQLNLSPSFADVFIPLGFTYGPVPGTMVPTYPAGLPMHLLAAAAIGGWAAGPFVVSAIAASGCLILMFLIGRRLGLSVPLAGIGALILGLNPALLVHALQPVSDVVATFWSLAAIFFALSSRRRSWYSIFAGVAFALGVWVRPTNILLAPALVSALGLSVRRLLLASVAALPFAGALMWLNDAMYGSAFRTGYGSMGELVSLEHVDAVFRAFVHWVRRMLTGVIFPGGLLVVLDRFVVLRDRAMLTLWFLPFFAFYSFYGNYTEWTYVRFLIPALPALIFGALLCMRDIILWSAGHVLARRAATIAVVCLLCVAVVRPISLTSELRVFGITQEVEIFPGSVMWAEQRLPRNALVTSGILSGAFYYYTGRQTVRYDRLTAERFLELRKAAEAAGLDFYAVISAVEVSEAEFRARMPGDWVQVGNYENVGLWRLN